MAAAPIFTHNFAEKIMREISFESAGESFTAGILPNGLPRQFSIRKITNAEGDALPGQVVSTPFTVKLLPDDDYAFLPLTVVNPDNKELLNSLASALGEEEPE